MNNKRKKKKKTHTKKGGTAVGVAGLDDLFK
jgi:hypothetical protein